MVKCWLLELQTESNLGSRKDKRWCHKMIIEVVNDENLEGAVSATEYGIIKVNFVVINWERHWDQK